MLDPNLNQKTPLAARMRPNILDDFIGQDKIIGKNGPLRRLIETDQLVSIIFWGPPGSGKTTLARIIANETKSRFVQVSAVESNKAEIRRIVQSARSQEKAQNTLFGKPSVNEIHRTILFIDEIHRFNKAQQDFLLPFVEDGTITLIGATTENPSFEVISPLLSRCRVFVLEQHSTNDIKKMINKCLTDKKNGLGNLDIEIKPDALDYMAQIANGDGRNALNILEIAVKLTQSKSIK